MTRVTLAGLTQAINSSSAFSHGKVAPLPDVHADWLTPNPDRADKVSEEVRWLAVLPYTGESLDPWKRSPSPGNLRSRRWASPNESKPIPTLCGT
ncbi:MAG: hypothetical protein ACKO2N_12950 [Tabrizicola sp.]